MYFTVVIGMINLTPNWLLARYAQVGIAYVIAAILSAYQWLGMFII
jgi:hypothetical protein